MQSVGLFQGLSKEEEQLFKVKIEGLRYKDNRAFGTLVYPQAKVLERALSDLISWVNNEVNRYRNGIDSSYDPIEIATIFKNAFFYLQPFSVDSDKIAKVFRDKILEIFGLHPERRIVLWSHLDATLGQDIMAARHSVYEMTQQIQRTRTSELYSVGASRYGMEVPELKDEPLAIKAQIPKNESEIFVIGNNFEKEFIFRKDGFFYDYTGVPYTLYIEPNGTKKMVPLGDNSFYMYGMGGEVVELQERSSRKVRMRKLNPPHINEFLKNYQFLQAMQKDPTVAQEVELVDYETTVADYNDQGIPFLWDFQEEMLSWAINIRENPETDPLAVLAQSRGNSYSPTSSGTTTFEQSFVGGKTKFTWTEIIGQYQMVDLDLRKMELYLKRYRKDWYRRYKHVIDASREKLHRAVRVVLADMIDLLVDVYETPEKNQTRFSPDSYKILKKHREMLGLYEYVRRTMIWHSDFKKARKKVNQNKILLMRVTASSRVDKMGFVPEYTMGKFVKTVPALEKAIRQIYAETRAAHREKREIDPKAIENKLAQKVAEIVLEGYDKDKNRLGAQIKYGIEKTITRLLVSIYKNRGLEREFERELIVMLLHAVNKPPKQGLSTTVSPYLLFKSGTPPFSTELVDPAIYIFEADLDDVSRMRSGKYLSEYEVYLKNDIWVPVSKFMIKRRFSPEEVKSLKIVSEEKAIDGELDPNAPWVIVTPDGNLPDEVKKILQNKTVNLSQD